MKRLARRAYTAADMAYGWSMIVTGAALIGVGLLTPHI